jgi:pimeloyl-ACP methyl ester carboxylesterase
MPKTAIDYIVPLNMNGLQGRMLKLPARQKSNKEILVVYGHHALLERWWGLLENLNQYANVTMPDLPGFGGMDSFHKIGEKPNIDSYADYLASFIKLRYRNRHIKIVAISYGFVIVTRMLQRYPELGKKVDLLVSATGFSHYDDFKYSSTRRRAYRALTRFLSITPVAMIFKLALLNPPVIRWAYAHTYNGRHKFKNIRTNHEFKQTMDMETKLWALNDIRTHLLTSYEFLGLNNCKATVNLDLEHIYSKSDHYFDNDLVEQHLNIIFKRVNTHGVKLGQHVTSVIASKPEAGKLLPPAVRRKLAS